MYCKHYYRFASELGVSENDAKLLSSDWDKMRTAETDGPFTIEHTAQDWTENCEKEISYADSVRLIVDGIGSEKNKG